MPRAKNEPEATTDAPISGAARTVTDLYAVAVRDVAPDERHAPIETPPCIVCGATAAHPHFEVAGLGFRVIDCTGCGTGTLDPLPSPAEIADFYPATYYGRGGSKFSGLIEWLVRLVAARHTRFLTRQSPPGARVLDV